MKHTLRLILGGLVAVAFTVAAQAAALVAGGFEARDIRGTVTYKLAGTDTYQPVVSGQPLPQGVSIKTGSNSSVSILFKSGATALVRPDTEIEVTKFEQALFTGGENDFEEPAVSNTRIALVAGEVVSNVKKLKAGSEYVVNSPVGAAGVRGTFFSTKYDAATKMLTVSTLFGSVQVTLPGDSSSSEFANAKEQVIIQLNKMSKRRIPFTDLKALQFLAKLFENVVGAHFPDLDTSQIGVSPN